MNDFYVLVKERLSNNYLLILGTISFLRDLEYEIYTPETSKNKDLDYFLYYEELVRTRQVIMMHHFFAKKSDALYGWLNEKGIKCIENNSETTLYIEADAEDLSKSFVFICKKDRVQTGIQSMIRLMKHYVPSGPLDKSILKNGTIVFTKKGKITKLKILKEFLNRSGEI